MSSQKDLKFVHLKEEARATAALARISFSEDELTHATDDLLQILAHVETLSQLDVAAVSPTFSVGPHDSVLREDEVAPSLPLETALANAPPGGRRGNWFSVPAVFSGK